MPVETSDKPWSCSGEKEKGGRGGRGEESKGEETRGGVERKREEKRRNDKRRDEMTEAGGCRMECNPYR